MSHKQQIIIYARHTSAMVRVAIKSSRPKNLMDCITQRLRRMWDLGCSSDTLTSQDKETARRCVSAVNRMWNASELI